MRLDELKQHFKRENELTWRYGFNLGPTLAHRRQADPLDGEAARVLAGLDDNGVAITSVDALLGGDGLFDELGAEVARQEALLAEEIEAARASTAHHVDRRKTYQFNLLGERAELEPNSIWARVAMCETVRSVVDAYFGMVTQIRDYNVWRNFATELAPRSSQLWHRDHRDDHFVLKMFVYLNDVDAGTGPFSYAPRSHVKGNRTLAPTGSWDDLGLRSTDEELAAVLPPDQWVEATGPAGTIILADTTGYHRGGWARTSDRVLFNVVYGSRAAQKWKGLVIPKDLTVDDPDVAFALDVPLR